MRVAKPFSAPSQDDKFVAESLRMSSPLKSFLPLHVVFQPGGEMMVMVRSRRESNTSQHISVKLVVCMCVWSTAKRFRPLTLERSCTGCILSVSVRTSAN